MNVIADGHEDRLVRTELATRHGVENPEPAPDAPDRVILVVGPLAYSKQ